MQVTENLWEEVAYWLHHDEEQNLAAINEHEMSTSTEQEATVLFQQEVKRRQSNDK